MTHTYVLLEISQSSYDDIKRRILAAGAKPGDYADLIGRNGELDMHGIALVPERPKEKIWPVATHQRCQSSRDGDCYWPHCPQLRDGEPKKTGRHCPLDCHGNDDD